MRVRRDDLLTMQVDGTRGSAIVGLRHCWIQPYGATPRPVWNPDVDQPINFFDGWQKVPEQTTFDNAFKIQWEMFLKHVALNEPFPWTLLAGGEGRSTSGKRAGIVANTSLGGCRANRRIKLRNLPSAPGVGKHAKEQATQHGNVPRWQHKKRGPEINVTPMIDVLLVLIIIFMVIQPSGSLGLNTRASRSHPMKKPSSSPAPSTDVVITVQANKQVLHQSGTRSRSRNLSGSGSRTVFAGADSRVVFVRADKDLHFEDIAQVIDIVKGVGLNRIALMTQ